MNFFSKFSKRWQLTLIYFLPILIILSLFSGIVFKIHSNQIDYLDEALEEIIYEPRDSKINFKLDDLPGIYINLDLGDDEIIDYENEEAMDYGTEFDEETGNHLDSLADLPYVSIEELNELEGRMKISSLYKILILLIGIIPIFGFLAYYFAGKTLKPMERALEKQKRFVSDASHELRTPLALMKSEAEVLSRSKDTSSSEYREFTNNVIQDVNYLDALTTNLLKLAKMDRLKPLKSDISIDIQTILNKLIQSFSSLSKEKKVEIINELPKGAIPVLGNRDLINQVLTIILDNAIKYNKRGGFIKVSSKTEKERIIIKIQDSGIGIPQKDIDQIFDRFYRASKDRNKKGHGLGLSIAKELMYLLRGEIVLESKEEEGTAISLVFSK